MSTLSAELTPLSVLGEVEGAGSWNWGELDHYNENL